MWGNNNKKKKSFFERITGSIRMKEKDDDFEDVEEADNTEEDDGVMNLAETELNDADFADSD